MPAITLWLSTDRNGYQSIHAYKPIWYESIGCWDTPIGSNIFPPEAYPNVDEPPREYVVLPLEEYENLKQK